ncbi:hypothetical protein [Faecalibacter rhinopitheci]|uniref:DUF1877 family protein n=1 Tax=Faecalibacter rhinopitheci TaxID=2779678 RepID=A0A8J7FX78_9FLAO|nr:hypothetical protein [Faecalibacter rhinopitheci]MBF0598376.1 hypothetical protein [Faecalibacter rhinopitheci]
MSAIVDFRKIKIDKLDNLKVYSQIKIIKKLFSKKVEDNYWNFINQNSENIYNFSKNGYVFGNLFAYLEEEKGINLLDNDYKDLSNYLSDQRNSSVFIFTYDQKIKFLNHLKDINFNVDELVKFNIDFSEEDDNELAENQIEAANALKTCLNELNDDSEVVLLNIG